MRHLLFTPVMTQKIFCLFSMLFEVRDDVIFSQSGDDCPVIFCPVIPHPHFIFFSELELPRWKGASFLFAENTFERFGYYGVRAVLLLFMRWKIIKIKISIILALHSRDMLGYDDNMSTVLYHVFVTLTYVWPLFLAILADSGLGKRNTIAIALVRI